MPAMQQLENCPYEMKGGKLRCICALRVEKVIDRIKREIKFDYIGE